MVDGVAPKKRLEERYERFPQSFCFILFLICPIYRLPLPRNSPVQYDVPQRNAYQKQLNDTIWLVSIPKNVQKKPFHRNPDTDVLPIKTGYIQKRSPFLSHINVLRNKQPEMAAGSIAKAVASGCGGINCGGGAVGA